MATLFGRIIAESSAQGAVGQVNIGSVDMKDLRPHRHYSFWDSARDTWKEWPTWNRVVVVIGGIILFSMVFGSPTQNQSQPRTPEQIRTQQIQQHFSAWNGAHEGLEPLVKSQLLSPDSYEHIETRYTDRGEYLIVTMKYEASNAFGVKIRQFVKAKTTIDGKVLEILEAR